MPRPWILLVLLLGCAHPTGVGLEDSCDGGGCGLEATPAEVDPSTAPRLVELLPEQESNAPEAALVPEPEPESVAEVQTGSPEIPELGDDFSLGWLPALSRDGRTVMTFSQSDCGDALVLLDTRSGEATEEGMLLRFVTNCYEDEDPLWTVNQEAVHEAAELWRSGGYRGLRATPPSVPVFAGSLTTTRYVRGEVEVTVTQRDLDDYESDEALVSAAINGQPTELGDATEDANGVIIEESFILIREHYCACECGSYDKLIPIGG